MTRSFYSLLLMAAMAHGQITLQPGQSIQSDTTGWCPKYMHVDWNAMPKCCDKAGETANQDAKIICANDIHITTEREWQALLAAIPQKLSNFRGSIVVTGEPSTAKTVFEPRDDGFGECPAFQHSHQDPTRCFDNDDNEIKPGQPELKHRGKR